MSAVFVPGRDFGFSCSVTQIKQKILKYFTSYRIGILAELFVAVCFLLQGYRLIHVRHRNYFGEVDLIMTRGNVINFVEVKYRSTKIEDIQGVLLKKQADRVMNAANFFCQNNRKYAKLDRRFDLAVVKPFCLPTLFRNISI